jgi:hypothetical protein
MNESHQPPFAPAHPPTNMSALRSQAEFFMTGVLPIAAPPDSECSICMEKLSADVVKMVACKHVYHCVCILAWFNGDEKQNRRCPNCREELYEAAPRVRPAMHSFGALQSAPMDDGYSAWSELDEVDYESVIDMSEDDDEFGEGVTGVGDNENSIRLDAQHLQPAAMAAALGAALRFRARTLDMYTSEEEVDFEDPSDEDGSLNMDPFPSQRD